MSDRVLACIRIDDITSRTPIEFLRLLEERAWQGRPVTHGVVPFAKEGAFRLDLTGLESGSTRSLSGATDHLRWLSRQIARGAEIALHGVDHSDVWTGHRYAAELECPCPRRVDLLKRMLKRHHEEFGTRTVIPPHNVIDEGLTARLLDEGTHVCRALPADALRVMQPAPRDRDEAKAMLPFVAGTRATDLYETLMVSWRRIAREGTTGAMAADRVAAMSRRTGLAVLTFHWWDFFDRRGLPVDAMFDFTADLLAGLESMFAITYTTLSEMADALGRGSCSDSST